LYSFKKTSRKKNPHFPFKKMSTTNLRSWTKAQIYVLPIIALIVGIIAIVLLVLVYQTNNGPGGTPTTHFDSVETKNGFEGSVTDHQLSLNLTVNGLLNGRAGAIVPVIDSDVTSVLLTGFDSTQTGTEITALDTIRTGIQKCAVLKQTKLQGFTAGLGITTVDSNDTAFIAMEKLQGNIKNAPFIFSAAAATVTKPVFGNLWGSPVFGSMVFEPNTLLFGTVMSVKTYGTIVISGSPNSVFFEFDFGGLTYPFTFDIGIGTFKYTFESTVSIHNAPPNAMCGIFHTLSIANSPFSPNMVMESFRSLKVIDRSIPNTMAFRAKLAATVANTRITGDNATAFYLFKNVF
jgi:hypothetical protein